MIIFGIVAWLAKQIAGPTAILAKPLIPHIPTLLLAFWGLAILAVVLTLLPIPIPAAFKAAVRLSAARGKLWNERPDALGPLKDVSVPQSFFEHFYWIGFLVNGVLLYTYLHMCGVQFRTDVATPVTPMSMLQVDVLMAVFLFQLHLMRRLTETAKMMVYPLGSRMHIIAYLFGLTYYIAMPFTLLPPSAFQYEAMRGAWTSAVQSLPAPMADFLSGSSNVSTTMVNATGAAGQPEAMNATESMNAALTSSEGLGMDMRVFEALHQRPEQEAWRLWVGVAVFVIGTLIQFWAHFSLARLASRVQSVREAAMQAATLGGGSEAARRAGLRKRPLAPRKQHTDKPDWGSSNGTKAEDSNSPQAADGAETSAAGTEEKPGTEGGMFDEYVTDVRVKGVAGGHYAAPKGGLFEWVSCPHYFGEIVIYGGLALVTRGAPGPLLALAWVMINLVLAADATHVWYKENFPEYPRRRRALIPFLY